MIKIHIYDDTIDTHGKIQSFKPFEVWFIGSRREAKRYHATIASMKRLNRVIGNRWGYYHMWTRSDGCEVWGREYRQS